MAAHDETGVTTYDTPNETDVVITRVFDAPRSVVFDAHTKPEHLRNWLLGPAGWTMPICELDLRAGGAWRYVWRRSDGTEMAMGGTVREVVVPERMVTTERWGPEWPETINTVTFAESNGKTVVKLTIRYPSKEAREQALQTGMKDGIEQSYMRLDELVRSLL
jgi:uncharacterized protein YndB with AHSA1/START domain